MFCWPKKQPRLLNARLCGFSCRYSIDGRSGNTKAFKIDPNNGTITVAKALDRETAQWHNVTVEAEETSKEKVRVSLLDAANSFILARAGDLFGIR